MEVTLPENPESDDMDSTYMPSTEMARLQTRIQVQKALRSSQMLTEKYWTIWKSHYLTALREQHRRYIDGRQGCSKFPREGEIVLLSEPCQKRSQWKMAKITKLVISSDGEVREAEVLCAKRTVKRPVNQLYPLEITGYNPEKDAVTHSSNTESTDLPQMGRYNLRPRRTRVPSGDIVEATATSVLARKHKNPRTWPSSLYLKMALVLLTIAPPTVRAMPKREMSDTSVEGVASNVPPEHSIECTNEGVFIHAPGVPEYELCVDNQCMKEYFPPIQRIFPLPSDILLHDYEIKWKIRHENRFIIIEKMCPAQPFCPTITCTMCAANLLNPECWPVSAILGVGALLYIIIIIGHTMCCMPLVIGGPFRILSRGLCGMCYIIFKCLWSIVRQCIRRRSKRSRIMAALAIMSLCSGCYACQIVNVFSHHMRSCNISEGRRICKMEMTSILKVNSFKKEACFRLLRNESTVLEVKMTWEGAHLLCEKTTIMYTRNATRKIIDSKRCPTKGSCKENKCAGINPNSKVEELELGNKYPGITGCYESCGGLGCDCFWPSSGCLFYRIYAVPTDERIFEIFSCSRWQERVKVKVHIKRINEREQKTYVLALQPNIPVQLPSLSFTLSVLALPPIPTLNTAFITTGNSTALWDTNKQPMLLCPSYKNARNLSCSLQDSCECTPAEFQVVCKCKDEDISQNFRDISNVLPVIRPGLKIMRSPRHAVIAHIEQGVSAEILLNTNEISDDSTVDFMEDQCTVDDTHIAGCYNCKKGAAAVIRCMSRTEVTSAEVDCGIDAFTVPCSPSGESSQLRFYLSSAKTRIQCSVRCGSKSSSFEITGVLKYVHNVHNGFRYSFQQEHNDTSGFQWPDFGHIVDVYLHWYKIVIITLASVVIALILTYL
ncbi:hypothetical protein GCK32_022899 [Trichostrongylus colubriformis]|uniref:Phlebovirus glycoprotein G2 fusion domain-containing protein n=1 Tax=Trichostrongylus colubriformis TaxID=6319 RepID=A0AAN8F1Q2_TRICO